jgi:hypothetical protein
MNWNTSDNKLVRGLIDRVFVALTEPYEREFFVDEFLKTHNYRVDDEGRKVVNGVIDTYTGRAPIKRTDLDAFCAARISPKK